MRQARNILLVASIVLLCGGCKVLDFLEFDAGFDVKKGPHIIVGVDFRDKTNVVVDVVVESPSTNAPTSE